MQQETAARIVSRFEPLRFGASTKQRSAQLAWPWRHRIRRIERTDHLVSVTVLRPSPLVKAIDEAENYNRRSIFFPDLQLKVLKTPEMGELW